MKNGREGAPLELYYKHLEAQFDSTDASTAILMLKLIKLDDKHGDQNIIEAVQYFVDKDCHPEKDAPTSFLTEDEVSAVHGEGSFRPKLYSMLLASKVADGIENKTLFITDSHSFAP